MMLFCDARPTDKTMALLSMAIVSDDDAHIFIATGTEDPSVVRQRLREFIANVRALDGDMPPTIGIEGFNFDQPVPKLVLERSYGEFIGWGPHFLWLDISQVSAFPRPKDANAVTVARLMREDFRARQSGQRRPKAPD